MPRKRAKKKLPTQKRRMRAPLRMMGSKGKLAPYLLPMIPPHTSYVEVFGGGAALLFAKDPSTSSVETYNDIDSALVEFFRTIRNPLAFQKFADRVRNTPYSREEWRIAKESWREEEDPTERVAKWFIVARQSFGGNFGRSWGMSTASASHSSRYGYLPMSLLAWLQALEDLPKFHWRLMRVQIEHLDWAKCIDNYDAKGTFFYLDPPYVWGTRRAGAYEHEMSDEQHKQMVEKLLLLRGMAMLSGYPNELYKPLEVEGWERTDFNLQVDIAGSVRHSRHLRGKGAKKTRRNRRRDCVWRNPACIAASEK